MVTHHPADPVATTIVGADLEEGRQRIDRGRGPLIAVAWVVGIGSIVAFALIGQGSDLGIDRGAPSSDGAVVAAATPASSVRASRPILAPALVPLTEDRLAVTVPATRNVAIRTRTVDVAGTVDGGGRVVVTLESRGAHLLESLAMDAGADGRFRVSFALPNPRPGGRMWVTAVLVADNGLPIEAIRRPIVSGPLDPPTLGDDGLIGGVGRSSGG